MFGNSKPPDPRDVELIGVDGMVPGKFYHAVSFEQPSQLRAIEVYAFRPGAVYVIGRTAQNEKRYERWPLVREA